MIPGPGPDDITISMIKHLTNLAKHTLLKALNKLWEASVYPEQWSKEIKLPFLKPGKDPNLPSSYRPISLTNCICKLFERMVNQTDVVPGKEQHPLPRTIGL